MARNAGILATLIVAAMFCSAAQADLVTNLAGLWTFEDGANLADDTSPFDNDGTVHNNGGSITQGAGIIGTGAANMTADNAVSSNHFIEIPNATQYNGTSQTVSYWIKTDYDPGLGAGEAAYVDHIRHSGHMSFKTTGQFDTDGGWAPITFDSGGGFGNSFNENNVGAGVWTGTYADGNWHHIVTVYDETTNTVKTWIDTELVVEDVQDHLTGGLTPTTNSLKFGGYVGWGASLVGSMDQIRIYDTAKSYQVDGDGTLIGGDLYEMYMEIPEPASLLLLALSGLILRKR